MAEQGTGRPTLVPVCRFKSCTPPDMKHYLAGPMTGIAEYNFPAFNAAAQKLRALGYTVVNPTEITGPISEGLPRSFYLRQDLVYLLTCDAIILLPGWENSPGALLERAIAEQLDMEILIYDDI